MAEPHKELQSLLFDWENGALDASGVERVREILRTDKDARDFFLRHQMLNAALSLEGGAGISESIDPDFSVAASPSTSPQQKSNRGILRINRWTAVAAAMLICALAGRVAYLEFDDVGTTPDTVAGTEGLPVRDAAQEATSQGVALVTRLVDVEWGIGQDPLDVGDAISPGSFAIKSGYAQVEFFCGATVVLEGPAELDLKSAMLAHVHRGRLRAQVPPAARGFSLTHEDLTVVDLGTEFGMSVSPDGADVQVFDGEVELQPGDARKRRLTAGQALARGLDDRFETADMTPDRFLDVAALESLSRGERTARYERWKAWSERFRQDPRLVAYYAFADVGDGHRRLISDREPTNRELDGAIVGARDVVGRWKSKSALEFKQPGDRVRVQIPGEFSSLTFACWVKIDSLDRWYNSLFLTDSYNHGEPHWQILDTGQLFFSVRSRPDDEGVNPASDQPGHQKVLSPPFWRPSMSGKWLHLATTYDVQQARTTHYLNGEAIHAEAIEAVRLVEMTRIGAASIGNWSLPTKPDAEFAVRNLNGSIDEFAVLAAALSADEIKEMYDHGKP